MAPRFRAARWPAAAALFVVLVAAVASEWDGRATPRTAYASSLAPRLASQDSAFAKLVERLSEPGGYFDSDNLISNETSYLHVAGRNAPAEGARRGVHRRRARSEFLVHRRDPPDIAFMLDIRRDNLLEHLLFKSLFAMSRNRIEYLCAALRQATAARCGSLGVQVDPGPRRVHRCDTHRQRLRRLRAVFDQSARAAFRNSSFYARSRDDRPHSRRLSPRLPRPSILEHRTRAASVPPALSAAPARARSRGTSGELSRQ